MGFAVVGVEVDGGLCMEDGVWADYFLGKWKKGNKQMNWEYLW